MIAHAATVGSRCGCGREAGVALAGKVVCRQCMAAVLEGQRPQGMLAKEWRLWRALATVEAKCEGLRGAVHARKW